MSILWKEWRRLTGKDKDSILSLLEKRVPRSFGEQQALQKNLARENAEKEKLNKLDEKVKKELGL